MRDRYGQPKLCMDCMERPSMKQQSFLCERCLQLMIRRMRAKADTTIDHLPRNAEETAMMTKQGLSAEDITKVLNLDIYDVYRLKRINRVRDGA